MSTTTKVWFQLFLGDTALDPVKVTLNQNDDIDDLKGAVKIECGENLQGVSSAQLRVYPPGTQVPIPEGADDTALDPRRRVDDLNGDSVTFVIVAPAIVQRATKRKKLNGEQDVASLIVLLEEKLNIHFERLKADQKVRSVPKTMHIYKIDPNELPSNPTLPPSDPTTVSAFSPEDSYWIENVQELLFDDCDSRGILFRPEIVKEMMNMVDNAFSKNRRTGIMIKGPEGIGKSHSLVNLVRTLQYDSSCEYLVTFIPDCDQWVVVGDLYTAICSSFGTSFSALSWPMGSDLNEKSTNLDTFVNAIDLILRRMKKKWVLVFDESNKLLSRFEGTKGNDLGAIPFPFSAIKRMMKGRHIVSVVSASSDKEIGPGFTEYKHSYSMDLEELQLAFKELAKESDAENILEMTGGWPLKVSKLISSSEFSIDTYEEDELSRIRTMEAERTRVSDLVSRRLYHRI